MQPQTSYFVCGTIRSGSSFLCEALSNTGLAGRPKEYFLPKEVPETWQRWGTSSYVDAPEKAIQEGMTPNGIFGAKLMWANFGDLVGSLRLITGHKDMPAHELLSTVFPNLQYIWITRSDKLRQAVSEWKAYQTDAWISWEERPNVNKDVKFNYFLIHDLLTGIIEHDAAWTRFFTESGIKPLVVVYEDLVLSYQATILRVLEYLKVEIPRDPVFPAPRMKKQADTVSEEWVRRYLSWTRGQRKLGILISLPYIMRNHWLRRTYVESPVRARLGRLGKHLGAGKRLRPHV